MPRTEPDTPITGAELAELEYQARAIDSLEAVGDVPSRARAAVKRRILLERLEETGLLAPPTASAPRPTLDADSHAYLLGYVAAAGQREAYLSSEQRTRRVGSGGADVTLDWFRRPSPAPEGVGELEWTAHWEAALGSDAPPDAPLGSVFVHDDLGWHRVEWRRERDSPALLRVEPVTSR